jgi:hypothetical protein
MKGSLRMPRTGFRFEDLTTLAGLSQDEFLDAYPYPFLLQVPVEKTESAKLMGDELRSSTQWVAPQEILRLVRSRTKGDFRQVLVHQISPREGQSTMTVGRVDPKTAGSMAVIVNNPTVSKHHAEFEPLGDVWRVCDLGSVNGTFINGKQLDPGVHSLLRDRDDLRFGAYQALFLTPKTLFQLIQRAQTTDE